MIGALCVNPCVDRTVSIPSFTYGGMNRIVSTREDGSGKGVNVALALDQIGESSVCVGTMGLGNGAVVQRRFEGTGCDRDWVIMPNPVRVNTKVLDLSNGRITEINEAGAAISPDLLERVTRKTLDWARKCSWMVLTGSTPPGCPLDYYASLTQKIHEEAPECRVFLDAEGERLRLGLKACPDMIKPNQFELELLFGHKFNNLFEIRNAARQLLDEGIKMVSVSMGGDGAFFMTENGAWFSPAMKVQVRSTVGAGDSMVAGMLQALNLGKQDAEVLRYGVAAAASSVTTEGTRLIDPETYRLLLPQVEIQNVEGE